MLAVIDPNLYLEELDRFYTGVFCRQLHGDHICCGVEPASTNGSPELVVGDGVKDGAAITGQWSELVLQHLGSAETQSEILEALRRARAAIPLADFADVVTRQMTVGLMIGAADSMHERETGNLIEVVKFAQKEKAFNRQPFGAAIEDFASREILSPTAFAALQDGAKRRAFTIAGLASDELIGVVHAELLKQVASSQQKQGGDLRGFKQFAKARLESAGWTPSSPAHVETIFRTNVLSAYNSGRHTEMKQPHVLAAMPYWQIRGVDDSRARPTHRAAFNICLPATHEFWQRAYPPFGYNCRCRVCSRTQGWMDRNGKEVGPVPRDLPDDGFEGGTAALIPVPQAALEAPKAQVAVPEQVQKPEAIFPGPAQTPPADWTPPPQPEQLYPGPRLPEPGPPAALPEPIFPGPDAPVTVVRKIRPPESGYTIPQAPAPIIEPPPKALTPAQEKKRTEAAKKAAKRAKEKALAEKAKAKKAAEREKAKAAREKAREKKLKDAAKKAEAKAKLAIKKAEQAAKKAAKAVPAPTLPTPAIPAPIVEPIATPLAPATPPVKLPKKPSETSHMFGKPLTPAQRKAHQNAEWFKNAKVQDGASSEEYKDWVQWEWVLDSTGSKTAQMLKKAAKEEFGLSGILREAKTAKPHSRMRAEARKIYEETQAHFRAQGIKTVKLYRGVPESVNVHTALESWTTEKKVAKDFGAKVWEEDVPVEKIFMHHKGPGWVDGPGYEREREYIVMH